jgi:O-acetylserine/cysteine efflux transporter
MKALDIFLAILATVIWGANFTVIKIGLGYLPPLLFTSLRFAFAALPLVFFLKRPQIPWKVLIAHGVVQFSLQFSLLFMGIRLGLPAGLASLVIQLQVFFTIGLAIVIMGEKALIHQVFGALIAFAGVALAAVHLQTHATLLGLMLVLIAGLCWACGNILTKKIGKTNAMALVAWDSLVAFPPLLLASYVMEGPAAWQQAMAHMSWTTVNAVLFNSYPNTIIGFGIWAYLMRKYSAATISPFALLVPVTGMLTATAVLGEPLQWWKIAAGVLVLMGLALNLFAPQLLSRIAARRS